MRYFILAVTLCHLTFSSILAEKTPTREIGPWFTGPLLTPSASILTKDHFNLEPYVYLMRVKGVYDANWKRQSTNKFWTAILQLPVQVGLNSWLDVSITPEVLHNHMSSSSSLGLPSASATQLGDLPLQIGFQLLRAKPGYWYPTIGFQITELFPTGRFNNLDPLKRRMDVGGLGSYATTFNLLVGKLYHLFNHHAHLSTRYSVAYTVFTPVEVKNFNTYGGGIGTKGRLKPGQAFQALVGLEYAFTLNWVAAMDIEYLHDNKSSFSGRTGFLAPSIPPTVGLLSSEQFSLAPALEYNFSEQLGVIAGVWFTVAGRNNFDFTSGIAAFNWYY